MNRAKKLFLLLILFGINTIVMANENVLKTQLKTILSQARVKYNLPGVTLSYKLPHKNIETVSVGYKNLKRRTLITADTLYPVGSITKSFTSVMLLELLQHGQLKLSNKLSMYASKNNLVAQYLQILPLAKNTTIRELLTHTSDAPASLNTPLFHKYFSMNPTKCYSDSFLMKNIVAKQAQGISVLKRQYHYTNTDYMLASSVLEQATNRSYCKNFNQLIKHLKFKKKSFFISCGCNTKLPEWLTNRMPAGYMLSSNNWPKATMDTLAKYPHIKIYGSNIPLYNVSPVTFSDISMTIAAGGLVTTTANLVKWYDVLFHGNILNSTSLKDLETTVKTPYGFSYGLGIVVTYLPIIKDVTISHNGSQNGFRSNVIYLKKHNIILAIATNSANDAVDLNAPLMNHIFTVLVKNV
jgi:D-alanyl-D-alanine carboxypeptidase